MDGLTLEELRMKQQAHILLETGPIFLNLPERWLDDPTWRCLKGHISKTFLKSESKGILCLTCGHPVVLTFPEDKE